jgi:hypothetical protein
MTPSITAFSTTTLSIKGLHVSLNVTMLYHYAKCYNAGCHVSLHVMLSVRMLSVIMLSLIMLSLIMLSVIMLSAIMLSVIMLSVIMLSVIMLNIIMLSVIMLSVIMLSVIMLSVITLSVIMLSVFMLNVVLVSVVVLIVVAPFILRYLALLTKTLYFCDQIALYCRIGLCNWTCQLILKKKVLSVFSTFGS